LSTQQAPSEGTNTPVQTPFADAASPFKRTEVPVFPGPPPELRPPPQSTWIVYRTQINLGLAMLAYLMVLVGSVVVLQANPEGAWRYYVAALPVLPAVVGLVIFVRAINRLDPVQVRIQLAAFAVAVAGTALITFAYGFLEGAGLPHLSPAYVLPMMVALWGVGTAFFTWRYR
jgi:hypothetical protein